MTKHYAYFSVERALLWFERGVDVICDGDAETCYGVPVEDEE